MPDEPNNMDAVLIVDDIQNDLDHLSELVASIRLPVHRATNMEDALRIIRQHPISMLVTDIVMPMYRLTTREYQEWERRERKALTHTAKLVGGDWEFVAVTKHHEIPEDTVDYSQFAGFRLLDEARELLPWLPVIIVSRYANLDMAREALGAKVQDIMSKHDYFREPATLSRSISKYLVPIDERLSNLCNDHILRYFATLSEEQFTKKVVIPFFTKLRYQGIRYVHGANECGLDVVFHETDRVGQRRFLGAQIKVGKIHKSTSEPPGRNIIAILQQIQQALESSFSVYPEHGRVRIDRLFVITSDKITQAAREYIVQALTGKVYAQHVDFMDGDALADLITMNEGKTRDKLLHEPENDEDAGFSSRM